MGALVGGLIGRVIQTLRERGCPCSDGTKRAQIDKVTWIGAGVGFLLGPEISLKVK